MAKKFNEIQKPIIAPATHTLNNNTQKKERKTKQPGSAGTLREQLSPYLPGILLFVIALIIGLLTYKDYGMAWDEPFQRGPGLASFNYIFYGDQELFTKPTDNHGAGYELLLIIIEKLMKLTDSRDIYLMRHLATHIFFLVGASFGYVLIFRLFKNKFLASLGFMMFVFAPRLYAHSFFNSKDIPFMFMILITLTVCQISFEKNKPTLFFLTGLACGYATSIRIMGVMLGAFILLFLLIDLAIALSKKEKPIKPVINILWFSVGFCALLYLGWPYLWKSPVHNLVESFNKLAHFDLSHGYALLNGYLVDWAKVPWTYFPTWFLITNPELWLITGIAGIIWISVNFFKRPLTYLKNTRERNFLLYLMSFFTPILAVIFLHSVLYNDWRHLYFVYPSFVLMAVYFIDKMMHTRYKLIVQGLCTLQLVLIAYFMIQYHPFHQVYFNNFVSHKPGYLRLNYDMEYWGCSYKQGIDHLLASDQSKTIKVNCDYMVLLANNISLLPEDERSRIQYVEKNAADYYVADSRGELYDSSPSTPVDSIEVLNSAIYYLFKEEKDPVKQKQMRWQTIANLRKILAIHPDDTLANARIGDAYRNNGVYDSAELYLKHEFMLQPLNIAAVVNLALLYNAEKKYPAAIELFRKALQLNPKLEGGQSNLGDAFFFNGDLDSAEIHEQLAIQQNPQNEGAINDLAGVYFFRKKYPQAIELYKSAIKLNPRYVKPYTNIGVCYIYLARYDSAIYYSNAALSIDPSFNSAYEIIAATYQAAGKPDLAKKYEAIAQKNNPAFKL